MSKHQLKCEECGRKLLIPSVFHGQKLCAICCQEAKKEERANLASEKPVKTRQITETKAACNACGNIWFYGKKDQWEQFNNQYNNSCMKPSLCCTCSPLALLMPDKKVTDLNKCPKCGSRAIKKEIVRHDV